MTTDSRDPDGRDSEAQRRLAELRSAAVEVFIALQERFSDEAAAEINRLGQVLYPELYPKPRGPHGPE